MIMKKLPPAANSKILWDILADEIRMNEKTQRKLAKVEKRLAAITKTLAAVQKTLGYSL